MKRLGDSVHSPPIIFYLVPTERPEQASTLYDLLHNKTVLIESKAVSTILRDVAQGLRFLHASNVLHGDLRAQHVIVDSNFRAKVTDFGLAAKRNVGASGSPHWMAPELLRGDTSNTTQSDVYSFGILMYEAYSRQEPYDGEDIEMVLEHVANPAINKRPVIHSDVPEDVHSIMMECFQGNPDLRPSAEILHLQLKNNLKNGETDKILGELFPAHIAESLKNQQKVEPESHEMVTIFFSDVVGYSTIAGKLSPIKLSDLMDRLYEKFDALSRKHDIFKVETIGDSWMGVTNLIKDQPDHVKRIAEFSVDVAAAAQETWIDPDDSSMGQVHIRVGFHSGPVVANVVGSRNPRYCLFGDTVNTASRMESHSQPGRIHCSETSAMLLREQHPMMPMASRGSVSIKDKGKMRTYWVNEFGRESSVASTLSESYSIADSVTSSLPLALNESLDDIDLDKGWLEAGNTNYNTGRQLAKASTAGDDADSSPTAEVFAEVTVFVADIVGFTAWCSTREPTKTFVLLERLHKDFNQVAKRRGVLMIDTFGVGGLEWNARKSFCIYTALTGFGYLFARHRRTRSSPLLELPSRARNTLLSWHCLRRNADRPSTKSSKSWISRWDRAHAICRCDSA